MLSTAAAFSASATDPSHSAMLAYESTEHDTSVERTHGATRAAIGAYQYAAGAATTRTLGGRRAFDRWCTRRDQTWPEAPCCSPRSRQRLHCAPAHYEVQTHAYRIRNHGRAHRQLLANATMAP